MLASLAMITSAVLEYYAFEPQLGRWLTFSVALRKAVRPIRKPGSSDSGSKSFAATGELVSVAHLDAGKGKDSPANSEAMKGGSSANEKSQKVQRVNKKNSTRGGKSRPLDVPPRVNSFHTFVNQSRESDSDSDGGHS